MSNQHTAPYLEALAAFARSEPARLHIPGHKGGDGADPELVSIIGERALALDIPALIEGIDVGAEPIPFQEAQRLAAEAWGARRTWFLVGGASQGNHAACLALRHVGRRVVMQRNVHSSAIDGSILAGLEPAFVAPELDGELGLAHCLTPGALGRALDETPDAVAALVVSPTYFGACADVAGLAAEAHSRNIPLVVDEAWGAHLRFSEQLPPSALDSGADLVISSTHKIVGSLTQAAMLHLGGSMLDEAVVDRVVTLLESTSPSALLGASLDAARRLAATSGEALLAETIEVLRETRGRLRALDGIDVLDEGMTGRSSIAGWDPLRLTVDVRGTGMSGHEVAALLRSEHNLFVELSSETVIVATFGLGGDARPLADRLIAAIGAVAADAAVTGSGHPPFAPPPPWGPLEMTPRDAFLADQEVVPLAEGAGRIAAEALAAYPPGIPNVLPGERLEADTLTFITETIEHGGHLRGASDRTLATVRVVREA